MTMPVNRLLGMFREQATFSAALPLEAASPASAFVACPVAFSPTAWQQQIYQSALERAREALAPMQFRRNEAVLWN
jgi:hypothetical protein